MNFSIIPLYTGAKAKIYTIKFADRDIDEYHKFVLDNMSSVSEAVQILDTQLQGMVCRSGLAEHFFKRESPESHNIYKIEKTEENLRIYCIKFSGVAIILGGGGIKKEGTIKLAENPHLQLIRDQLMRIEDLIGERIKSKEIILTDDKIEGNLHFS